jgi:hypothetical protein
MAFTPENSRIITDAEFEAAVAAAASAEEIKSLMHDRAIQQGIVTPDRYSPDVLLATPLANSMPKSFAQRLVVDGKTFFLEAESQAELDAKVADFIRSTTQTPATQTQTEHQPRDAAGRFTADQGRTDENAFARNELELKFKRGEISTDEYLSQSGAIERHLAEQGVDMEALREASGRKYEQSWEQATQEFLQSGEGRTWPGGEENKQRLGQVLIEMGLIESPSAESLARAYEYLRENDGLVPNPEVQAHQKISEATTFEEIVEAARRSVGR